MEIVGYEVLEEIGRGASAVVYRARQVAFDRIVALKVLAASDLGDVSRRRFQRECRAIGNLGWHPRVVPVYDAGISPNGHPYLVMEYLPAGSLAHRVRSEGPLPENQVLAIGTQVADALDAAHGVGVLHRDVKPGNILVGHFGDAKLADFGIAAVSSANTSVTDALAGTLSFMAPELLKGNRATTTTDVYALGSTLFTLLTGRTAYSSATDGSPLASLMRVMNDPLPDLRQTGASSGLTEVIERAMAKEPEDRYPTARDMVNALQDAAIRDGWDRQPTYADRSPSAPITGPPTTDPAPSIPPVAPVEAPGIVSPTVPPVATVGQPQVDDHPTILRRPAPEPPAVPEPGTRPEAPTEEESSGDTILRQYHAKPTADDGDGTPPAPPPAIADTEGSRRSKGAIALVLAGIGLAAVLALVFSPFSTKGGNSQDLTAAVDRASTATTIETTTPERQPRATTTAPPAASAQDIATADPAGTFTGGAKNGSCEGFADGTTCDGEGIFDSADGLTIRCPATGCVARVGLLNFPLSFNGASHEATLLNVSSSFTCGDEKTPMQSDIHVTLTTVEAAYRAGGWKSQVLTGKVTQRIHGGTCNDGSMAFDLLLTR